MMPDLVRFFRKDWSLYVIAHKSWWAYFIPFWNVHVIMDLFCHGKDGKWYWWVVYVEIGVWIWLVSRLI